MLNEMYIDNKQATYQVWEKNIYQPIGLNDLELLGTFFDAHQRILFLCAAGGYLYHLSYNVIENKLSNSLKRSAKLPETIYNAKVYELNENIVKWYLLGETNIYQLEVERSTFVGKLIPYPKRYYPRDITIENKLHEGGSLVVFDRLPWVIGGKDFKNGINTSRRLFTGGCYFTNPGYTQCPGRVEHNFLSHERTSPIVHMYDDKFICIGGNSSSQPENIMEFINIRPYYPIPRHGQAREDDATRVFTTLRSIVAYSNKNCGLQTTSPSPASCLFLNSIFIFTNQIFNKKPIYYKYNFNNGGTWEFLVPEVDDPKSLSFTSANAITIGKDIYLILFNAVSNKNVTEYMINEVPAKEGTTISIYKIKEI